MPPLPFPRAKQRARVLALLLLLSVLSGRAEEWVLSFAVREEKVLQSPQGEASSRTEARSYTQTVALGPDYLVVQDDRRKTVFDFAGRRMHVANLVAGTQENWSLFFLPSFLEHELHNRAQLGGALRSAKIEQAADMFDRFNDESALRVATPAQAPGALPAPVIEALSVDGGTEFRHAGRTAVRFVPAAQDLPAAWHHRFVNYLAYACCIHPEIRRSLAATKAIPQELAFTWRAVNATTTSSLRLISSAAAATDSSRLPDGGAAHGDGPLHRLLARVNAAAANPARPGRDEVIRFARTAAKGPRPLDALLALMEYGMQSGEQLTDELRRHGAAFKRDPACAAYLQALEQSDKAAAEKSLTINAKLDRAGLTKAHMLELQRANLLERAGRPREAIASLLTVLGANPYHAGALHDLGAVFLRSFEHEKAWLCWDAARQLYPGHPMMRGVIRLELDLVRKQPDFF